MDTLKSKLISQHSQYNYCVSTRKRLNLPPKVEICLYFYIKLTIIIKETKFEKSVLHRLLGLSQKTRVLSNIITGILLRLQIESHVVIH